MWTLYLAAAAITTFETSSEVVDNHVRTARSKEHGVCSAESTASAGNDDGLAVPPHLLRHFVYVCEGMTVKERKDEEA